MIISNYNTTTATAIAASGGYINTLLGSVIPLVPVTLPYLALVLLGFKRLLLACLTAAAALFISPAEVTFPKLMNPFSRHGFKVDWHRFAIDHPAQTGWTALILIAAALFAAWQWDGDVRDDVKTDVDKIQALTRPVRHDANLEIKELAKKYRVPELTVERWANGRLWFRSRTLTAMSIAFIASILYVSYVYPFPRSKDYYEAILRTPWLPAETISLRSGDNIVGYPLSSDVDWMVVLSDASRTIQYVPAGDVVARVVCNASSQGELVTTSPPIFPLLKSRSSRTPRCGNPSSTRLQVSRWITVAEQTSSTSFSKIPLLSGIRICSLGPIVATLSVELREVPAGFRIMLNGNMPMEPGRVRFVPAGLHDSSSFTFISNEHAPPRPLLYVLAVEWRSPTGQVSMLERATVSVTYEQPDQVSCTTS